MAAKNPNCAAPPNQSINLGSQQTSVVASEQRPADPAKQQAAIWSLQTISVPQ